MLSQEQNDILIATADLVGRSGARNFEIGYLHDDAENPGWWAHADFGGHRIIVEDFRDPILACWALSNKILTGAKCKCGRLVALSDEGAFAFVEATMMDGTTMTAEDALNMEQCRWYRIGDRWHRECEKA